MAILLTIQPDGDEKNEFFHSISENEILLNQDYIEKHLKQLVQHELNGEVRLQQDKGQNSLTALSKNICIENNKALNEGSSHQLASGDAFSIGSLRIVCCTQHERVEVSRGSDISAITTKVLLGTALVLQVFFVLWLPSYMSSGNGFERDILLERVAVQLDSANKQFNKTKLEQLDELHGKFANELRDKLKARTRKFRLFPEQFSTDDLQNTLETLEQLSVLRTRLIQRSQNDTISLPPDQAEEILSGALK